MSEFKFAMLLIFYCDTRWSRKTMENRVRQPLDLTCSRRQICDWLEANDSDSIGSSQISLQYSYKYSWLHHETSPACFLSFSDSLPMQYRQLWYLPDKDSWTSTIACDRDTKPIICITQQKYGRAILRPSHRPAQSSCRTHCWDFVECLVGGPKGQSPKWVVHGNYILQTY
jgi:hypothetical protein